MWTEKQLKNLTLPTSLSEFEKFYNQKNQINPKVVMYGNTSKDQGSFNRTNLQLTKKLLGGKRSHNLTLPSALGDFQMFYNMHDNKHIGLIQFGYTKTFPGWLCDVLIKVNVTDILKLLTVKLVRNAQIRGGQYNINTQILNLIGWFCGLVYGV